MLRFDDTHYDLQTTNAERDLIYTLFGELILETSDNIHWVHDFWFWYTYQGGYCQTYLTITEKMLELASRCS